MSLFNTESVGELFLFADTHNMRELRAKCVDFIREHISEVMISDGWATLISKKLELVPKLIAELAKKTKR